LKEGDAIVGVEYTDKSGSHTEHGPVIIATGGFGADFDEVRKEKEN
tara:strand:- start:90 stop:227 length:138 start_codon:yes stop_codon:yes gene_type:complete